MTVLILYLTLAVYVCFPLGYFLGWLNDEFIDEQWRSDAPKPSPQRHPDVLEKIKDVERSFGS